MFRKFKAIIFAVVLSLALSISVFANPTLRFEIGSSNFAQDGVAGQTIDGVAPYIDPVTGSPMVPLRTVAEAFGATISWVPETSTVVLNIDGTISYFSVVEPLPGGLGMAAIVDRRVFVPLEFVAFYFGTTVNIDEYTNALYVIDIPAVPVVAEPVVVEPAEPIIEPVEPAEYDIVAEPELPAEDYEDYEDYDLPVDLFEALPEDLLGLLEDLFEAVGEFEFVEEAYEAEELYEAEEIAAYDGVSAYELLNRASEAIMEAGSALIISETVMEMVMDGEMLEMTMTSAMGQVIRSETDMDLRMESIMVMDGMEIPSITYFRDGVYYMDIMGERFSMELPLETILYQSGIGVAGFPEGSILEQEIREIEEGTFLSFIVSGDALSDFTNAMMSDMLGSLGLDDIEMSISDVNFSALIDEEGNLHSMSMVMSYLMELEGSQIYVNMDMIMLITEIGGITIDFPDWLDEAEAMDLFDLE